jgi:Zn finger protein HypA/HybF involved in hydrogenase expression
MSLTRAGAAGATRICPHCRAVVLDTAVICPACQHHLRFNPGGSAARPLPSFSPLRVEGTIRHPAGSEAWEYSVLLSIRNDRGEEISRQVVGVGALHPSEERTFSLAVEVFTAGTPPPGTPPR